MANFMQNAAAKNAREKEQARCLAAIAAEEELDGPMPELIRQHVLRDPETVCRAIVIATKKSIETRIRSKWGT